MEGTSAPATRRDPYEVLCVAKDSTDQEIKTAYRKLALKYHPDKNSSNPEASERFKEVAFSYSILSDPEKRRQYDTSGFEAVEDSMDMEIDLSNLGTVNTMFAALFSKLGVPIKTTISAIVLEEALNGTVTVRPLPIGTSVSGKVEKQCAHFFGVTINNEQAEAGIVVRATSAAQSKFKERGKMIEPAPIVSFSSTPAVEKLILKLAVFGGVKEFVADFGEKKDFVEKYSGKEFVADFGEKDFVEKYSGKEFVEDSDAVLGKDLAVNQSEKNLAVNQSDFAVLGKNLAENQFLLHFEQDVSGGYGLALQEDSEKTGKVTSAGMYFLHFQVYRMDSTVNALAIAKDPESAFFKRLEGLEPCEVSELKAGTHIFATASYTIEAICAKSFEDTTEKLKAIEAQILTKRNELRLFETEYRKALARYQEVTNRYSEEKQCVEELLKQRDSIHSTFTLTKAPNTPNSIAATLSNGSSSNVPGDPESPSEDGNPDKSSKKKWFNLNLKGSDKKLG
ncbi:hypothetical protein GQ457_04G006390 [Hibiscus cannabinus]